MTKHATAGQKLTPQQRWYRRKKKQARAAEYYLEHKQEHLEYAHQRRARIAGNEAIPYKRSDVLDKYGMWCYLCWTEIKATELVLDHVIPIKKGGPDSFDNVRPTHDLCNRKKGDRIVGVPAVA